MTEVLHANIFFVIASVGVVLFTFLVCIALYHVIKVIRSIRRIVERIEAGSEIVAEDLQDLRTTLSPRRIISLFFGMMGGRASRSRRRRNESDEESEE